MNNTTSVDQDSAPDNDVINTHLDEDDDEDPGKPTLSDFAPVFSMVEGIPSCISKTLAVRQCILDYEGSGYIATSNRIDRTDLELKYCQSDVSCLISRRFSPVHSYPCKADKDFWVLEPGVEGRIMEPKEMISELRMSGTSWILGGRTLEKWNPSRVKGLMEAYAEPPLHVYVGVSLRELELVDFETKVTWSRLYNDMITMPRKQNLYGTITNNCYVDMRPYEETDDYSLKIDISKREFNDKWKGFIDPGHTVSSIDAGRIRSLVHKVRIRTMTPTLIRRAEALVDIMTSIPSSDERETWSLYFMGSTSKVYKSNVYDAVESWRLMDGHEIPSLHVFSSWKLVTLSVSSGCLVRPLSVIEDLECKDLGRVTWVDSMVFNSAELRTSLSLPTLQPTCSLEYSSTFNLMAPYVLWNEWPRPTLAFNMSSQAIALPYTTILSTVAPKVSSSPLVLTPLMETFTKQLDRVSPNFDIPGQNIVVLFANFIYTYEASVIVSSEAAKKSSCKGQLVHSLPSDVRTVVPGTVLNKHTHRWWRSGDQGVVVSEGYSRTKGGYIIARIDSPGLRVGDKVATCHGQKQTVSQIVDIDRMPLCYDKHRDRSFRPGMIIAASSIHNRGTPGQLYEARAGMRALDSRTDAHDTSCYVTSLAGEDAKDIEGYECTFTHIGSENIVMSSFSEGEPCIADYGACRIWALAHMSRDKQHFCSSVPKGTRGPSGKLSGSSVRIGEMELSTMMSKGWIATASEVLDSSDQAYVSTCSRCKRLVILCDCALPPPPVTGVLVRSELAKLDVCRAVHTINSNMGSLTPSSHWEEGNGSKDRKAVRPTSFKYHT